ncbi:hypothetical protein Tco_0235776 [Tanacetum coccineum]
MREPTMEEYMTKTQDDYGSGIVRPKIDDKARFKLKRQFLKELRDNTFSGSDNEDAHEHIEKELWLRCPQHYLTDMHEVILFHKGLDVPTTRQILDPKVSTDTSDGLAAIQAQLNNLGREIKKVNEKVYAAQEEDLEQLLRDSTKEITKILHFIVLDMPEDVKVPLILRRPFVSTTHAKIDVFDREITLRERMKLDLEATLMGETLRINRSQDPSFEGFIELIDLNTPVELRRNQVEDLSITISDGEWWRIWMASEIKTWEGVVIFGEPFCKASCVEARRFDGLITIHNGNDNVTYQIARSHPKFKYLSNAQCNKIRPLLKVSVHDKLNGISHLVVEDIHDLRSVETEFPAIDFNDEVSSKTLSYEPTVCSLNDEIDFRISFDESDDEDYTIICEKNSFSYKMIFVNNLKMDSEKDNEKVIPSIPSPKPVISCFDDLDFFKDFENEFPSIVYNDVQTSKSDLLIEPTLNLQHINELNLNDETSMSKYDEEERNILYFKDLFPFNIIRPDDLKLEKDNDNNEIDIIQSLEDNEITHGLTMLFEIRDLLKSSSLSSYSPPA